MKKVTKAVIPAAGLGTRVLPATKAMPKGMLPLVDKPAIQYLVERGLARSERRSAVNSARSSRLNQPARQPQPQEAVHAQLS